MEAERTLSIHNLPEWVTEAYIYRLFAPTQSVLSVKVSKTRSIGGGRVAFMTMSSRQAAASCLRTYHGTSPPNVNLRLELAWANQATPKFEDFSAFVGDLAPAVTNAELLAFFQARYPSAFEAHIVSDPSSGKSKEYGFVRFADEAERDRSLQEMQGAGLRGRALRVNAAAKRTPPPGAAHDRMYFSQAATQADFDTSNTTLFVGNLSPAVTEAELIALFQPYGAMVQAHIPPGKGCGFVQFIDRSAAETALQSLQSMPLHGSSLRLSWGQGGKPGRTGAAMMPALHMQPHGAYMQAQLAQMQGAYGAGPVLPSYYQAGPVLGGGGPGGATAGAMNQPTTMPVMAATPHVTPQRDSGEQHAQSARARQGATAQRPDSNGVQDWAAFTSGYYASAPQTADDVYHGLYGEAAATSGEGVGHGGYTGHPEADRCASRFGFEDPLTYDFDASNRRFCSVAPPMLAPIAMAPARFVLRGGVASTV